jgi:hypothetical protein
VSAARAEEQAVAHLAIRLLGAARERGEGEDVRRTAVEAEAGMRSAAEISRTLLKQADHLMLAGDYRGARSAYCQLICSHPDNPLAWAKLARLGLFRTFPRLREACFR